MCHLSLASLKSLHFCLVVTVNHVCVFKDGDTHVGVEDTDDAEEMDIGWYLFTFANSLTATLAASIITEFLTVLNMVSAARLCVTLMFVVM